MTEEVKNTSQEYSADSIQVLEGLEAVRKRPAMYIGDISEKGLHHLVYEVVDNSIDEALAGFCTHIEVVINEDNSITVTDNGRGIPVDIHEKEGKSALEVVLTVLHAGGKFDKGTYKVSGGLHGVGVSCVNALSTYLKAEVRRNGKIYMQEFACGKPLHDVKEVGTSETTGTTISFKPDGSIFTTTEYKYDILATRLRELAFLNAGITLTLTDKRVQKEDGTYKSEIFHSVEGFRGVLAYRYSAFVVYYGDRRVDGQRRRDRVEVGYARVRQARHVAQHYVAFGYKSRVEVDARYRKSHYRSGSGYEYRVRFRTLFEYFQYKIEIRRFFGSGEFTVGEFDYIVFVEVVRRVGVCVEKYTARASHSQRSVAVADKSARVSALYESRHGFPCIGIVRARILYRILFQSERQLLRGQLRAAKSSGVEKRLCKRVERFVHSERFSHIGSRDGGAVIVHHHRAVTFLEPLTDYTAELQASRQRVLRRRYFAEPVLEYAGIAGVGSHAHTRVSHYRGRMRVHYSPHVLTGTVYVAVERKLHRGRILPGSLAVRKYLRDILRGKRSFVDAARSDKYVPVVVDCGNIPARSGGQRPFIDSAHRFHYLFSYSKIFYFHNSVSSLPSRHITFIYKARRNSRKRGNRLLRRSPCRTRSRRADGKFYPRARCAY